MRGAAVPDAERALISCLLRLDVPRAAAVTTLVRLDDLADPALAQLLTVVTHLVERGIAPEPNAVLGELRACGLANGGRLMHAVSLLLAELYASAAVPASALFYVASVLADATRRRAQEAGTRIAQAAELVPIADLPELITQEVAAVLVLAQRAQRAAVA